MPSVRDIRRRIKSVRNTAKITKAMQLVAASKMRRAQQAAMDSRDYARLLYSVMAQALRHVGDFRPPLMEQRPVRKSALIVISPDKGLCGPLVSNLVREAMKHDPVTTVYVAVGKKAGQAVTRLRRTLLAEFAMHDRPHFADARAVSKFAQDLFLKDEVQRVQVLFTDFISTVSQKPVVWDLLPIGEPRRCCADLKGEKGFSEPVAEEVHMGGATEFKFEPSAPHVLDLLLPYALNYEIFQMMLESRASEYSARMVSMKNATDNAEDLIHHLTLTSNKMRQAAITKELLDITTAALAGV
ncbi:MAG: ATP synthase F1 subunit gamma [Lentisphaerae bacterium RIFOXYB12_FULL_65_16]|nr:MAG: ATP synthase F1 subunit gamma [Lentisphaerae bacterium RIFOXYA12_64_32]OGV86543.1 MAG: ATP synthase F1 subunit gamma [Lentisphaerae bacterium RIFOXYB12_FULL_65_16]